MKQDISLDRVHELLDGVVEERDYLIGVPDNFTNPSSLPILCDAVAELDFIGEIHILLRVPRKLINSFTRTLDEVLTREAIILASKIISYLKSIEGEVLPENAGSYPHANQAKKVTENKSVDLKIAGSSWTTVPRTETMRDRIAQLSITLDSILSLAKHSNYSPLERGMTDLELAQLIAILETALAILKAPLVEKGLLTKLGKMLKRSSNKVAAANNESALGEMVDDGAKLVSDLIPDLFPK